MRLLFCLIIAVLSIFIEISRKIHKRDYFVKNEEALILNYIDLSSLIKRFVILESEIRKAKNIFEIKQIIETFNYSNSVDFYENLIKANNREDIKNFIILSSYYYEASENVIAWLDKDPNQVAIISDNYNSFQHAFTNDLGKIIGITFSGEILFHDESNRKWDIGSYKKLNELNLSSYADKWFMITYGRTGIEIINSIISFSYLTAREDMFGMSCFSIRLQNFYPSSLMSNDILTK